MDGFETRRGYDRNPRVVRDRRLGRSSSAWARSFAADDVRPLIVCRGPIRKEAMDVFAQMGIEHYGILLSEKDSIVYTHALAPELRCIHPAHVHRVKDYTGATKDERVKLMQEIVAIARAGGYTHVFAGYGFMAEDEEFVRTLEEAGLVFIGPRSSVQRAAGLKDEAKRTALAAAVSVTPGIDDATRRIVLRKWPDHAALRAAAADRGLLGPGAAGARLADGIPLAEAADALLAAAYARRVDLYTTDELCEELERGAAELLARHPGRRIRLKAIGGGGGKGQRLLAGVAPDAAPLEAAARARAAEVPALAREILAEVKAAGVGDNKNILLELNVEETRHNEIQLVGNGAWCVALGGRDCSLQMHEQKLLEVAMTQEGLLEAIERARAAGEAPRAASLERERASLARMEAEAERFGQAVGLNSASTFECIVEGDHHYFMEVNTRIQVEHRVSELCYALRFENPADPADAFEVTSLVECMVLLARHGERLPRPIRVRREGSAVEARLNATNGALEPHAAGIIVSWSDPHPHEIRDDQGICVKNPDTGVFMHYRVAGAYDSNIALLVTYGASREEAYQRICEILRTTTLRGSDLHTNLLFHYGLVHWFLARSVWAKPTTGFVVPYLTQVGLLAVELGGLDFDAMWAELGARHERRLAARAGAAEATGGGALKKVFALKDTLVRRPVEKICAEPHLLSAWLSRNMGSFEIRSGRVRWLKNPIEVLADTYWLLNMTPQPQAPAAHVIWDHDQEVLSRALGFYRRVGERMGQAGGAPPWPELRAHLSRDTAPHGDDAELWRRVRGAHLGFQAGLELLDALVLAGDAARFFELRAREDGTVAIPERLLDRELSARMRKVLAPPPAMRANEIVAVTGGMFYAQEAPDRPPLVTKGSHFAAGDPLYVIEVMKMFNKVLAPCSGTVEEVLIDGGEGTIVQKGQPLFRVKPDEVLVEEDSAERARRRRETTLRYVDAIFDAEGP
ncbi:biotin carboxylase N-terminal domain-containing protein [Sorangium sp. So ce426]|uniref:ATP-binding protein n=1 Tax=Sorangium sp. So ce426 TaxID=3133312 RepID=UPI003F5AE042